MTTWLELTATEVKARILGLLDEVARGEEIAITKHGRVVAKLVPATGPSVVRGEFSGIAQSSANDEDLFSTGAAWNLP